MTKNELKPAAGIKNTPSAGKEPNRQASARLAEWGAKAHSRAAREDLDCWLTMFRLGSLEITNMESCDREFTYVRRVIRRLCQDDYRVSARQLNRIAGLVEDETPFSKYEAKLCDDLVQRLVNAADCEKDPSVRCPWWHCSKILSSHPRLSGLAKFIWEKNPNHRREWSIALDVVKEDVWQEPGMLTRTVRSGTCELQKLLRENGVPITITTNDAKGIHRVRCSLPADYEFGVSW